jgi:hypothetical protein
MEPPSPVCDDAEFAGEGRERLWLSRKVADEGPVGLIIGLNPSKAGARREDTDHTITKELEYARRWGWSGFWKCNLFTVIETESAKLRDMTYLQAVGPHGSAVLETLIPLAPEIVVCWGNNVPKHMRHRISAVTTMLSSLKQPSARVLCFGITQSGAPVHPLRLAYDTHLVPYDLPKTVSRRDD